LLPLPFSRCNGSIKYLHQDCLMEWLRISKKSEMRCELCGEKFSFRRVYAPDAPTHLSYSEFLLALLPMMISFLKKLSCFTLLVFCWFIWVPSTTIWWLTFCFHYLASGTWDWKTRPMPFSERFAFLWGGIILCLALALMSSGLFSLLRPIFLSVRLSAIL
jgi:hypothetical protein